MALIEGCKHELEIVVPVEEVAAETTKVAEQIRSRVQLPGFRPGKAPLSMIRQRFGPEIRQEVLQNLLPRFFERRVEQEHLEVVGRPNITEIEFKEGQPLKFKAQFEVAPQIELQQYRGISVPYAEPRVSDEEVEARLEQLRAAKAEYVNLDPRPAALGDIALIDLQSVTSLEGGPVQARDMQVELGGADTLPEFTDNIVGMTPGEEKTFSVSYPDDYAQPRLAGKTVQFRVTLKLLQRKELPELNDEFAQDVGDYQNLTELQEALRRTIFREREAMAQREAKEKIVDRLVEMHDFPVPEAYVERQVEIYLERLVNEQAAMGRDPSKFRVDFAKAKEAMGERARREVKASLLLERIANREAITALKEEVDAEIQRYARQEREPVAAVRKRFDENGTTNRIAHAIQVEKVLNFLFEHARKEAPSE